MTVYATLVSVVTVYGRYHYAVNAVAGLAISVAAAITVKLPSIPLRAKAPKYRKALDVSTQRLMTHK